MILHPPRREPRILAIARSKHGMRFAVADPWSIRSVGFCRMRAGGALVAIRQLLRREHPSAVVVGHRKLKAALDIALRGTGIGTVRCNLPPLPLELATDLFPELTLHAPTRALQRVTVLALRAVLHGVIPTRSYATSRKHRVLRAAA